MLRFSFCDRFQQNKNSYDSMAQQTTVDVDFFDTFKVGLSILNS